MPEDNTVVVTTVPAMSVRIPKANPPIVNFVVIGNDANAQRTQAIADQEIEDLGTPGVAEVVWAQPPLTQVDVLSQIPHANRTVSPNPGDDVLALVLTASGNLNSFFLRPNGTPTPAGVQLALTGGIGNP